MDPECQCATSIERKVHVLTFLVEGERARWPEPLHAFDVTADVQLLSSQVTLLELDQFDRFVFIHRDQNPLDECHVVASRRDVLPSPVDEGSAPCELLVDNRD